jgi:hypothetical protein
LLFLARGGLAPRSLFSFLCLVATVSCYYHNLFWVGILLMLLLCNLRSAEECASGSRAGNSTHHRSRVHSCSLLCTMEWNYPLFIEDRSLSSTQTHPEIRCSGIIHVNREWVSRIQSTDILIIGEINQCPRWILIKHLSYLDVRISVHQIRSPNYENQL